MAGAEQSIVIEVPREFFLSVVTDYERYPDFLTDMKHVSVVSVDGHVVDVDFVLHLVKRIEYRLRLSATPPTGLSWTLVEGMFQRNEGGWVLESVELGTRATYRIDVGVGVFVPGSIVNRLVGQTLPETLRAFKERAEALWAETS